MEDFNSLLLHEQVELLRAQCARTETDRILHSKGARAFAKLIEEHEFPYRSRDKQGHVFFDAHAYDGLWIEECH